MQNTLHEAFEARAAVRQDAVAVNLADSTLSYRELDARSNQLAARLRSLGVRPEVPVALFLDRSPEMALAILGVLKAGGCYVPIDLAYPKDRVAFMLGDTEAPIILTQERLASSLPVHPATVLRIDADWPDIAAESPLSQPAGAVGGNAAYVIYTSGSTGKPKGVVVTHRNVVRLLEQTDQWYGFGADDVWPLFHSYAFDVSVWELWGSLLYGGRLVIVPYLVSRSPSDFYQLLAREKVTVLNQTPSAFRQLIWAETNAEAPLELNLRCVICAGEALELQSLKPWFDRHGDKRPVVVNMYGITETTVHSTYRPITRQDLTRGAGSVIGVPIPDLQIHLLDDQLKPVPPGLAGEICVGGAGVARGYLKRDELTSQRFLPDPFSSKPGARIYRSGDLARRSERGEMEYLGRMDHQVKIRGFRVELGEIESALNRHPAIRESVVLAREESDGPKWLAAYIVPTGAAPTVTELREYLGQCLPEYMIPARFMVLNALPLTTNGKVDRRALPAPSDARPALDGKFTPPRNEIERKLAHLCSQVLGVAQVGVLDNLFELGGDSIRSIAILWRARELGLKFSLPQMFERPTVEGMAACALSAEPSDERQPSRPFDLLSAEERPRLPEDVEDAYPLARLQLGMFFHNELNPASAVYHDVFSFRIESAFDREKLADSLSHLIQRHPILRTSFHLAGFSEPLQWVHRQARFRLTVDDLREAAPVERATAPAAWIEREKRAPFDRTAAPLLRFHVQWLDETAFQFIVSFHHACLDGWSLAAVLTEIFQVYAALLKGDGQIIPPPRVAYRDFVALERQTIASAESRRFWTEKLAGATLQTLPRWPKSMCSGGLEQTRGPEMQVEADVLQGLKDLARRAGVPLKSVLLAAHQRVLGLLYGQTEVTTGLLCNGRPETVDGEKVIGLFLNTLPLRLSWAGGRWMDLVRQCFAAEREIAPHRRFPLAEIQKLNGGRPVFAAAFDFVQFHVYNDLQGGIDLREGCYFEANDLAAFTTFMLDAPGASLDFHIDYDPNRLCRRQIEEMSAYYANTLRAMTREPEGRCDAFSPMPPAERERLLVEWNRSDDLCPPDDSIHALFERRAAGDPLKTALAAPDGTWTYRDLNRRANDVARQLTALGAGPNVLVGICMERSADMLAGLLGILKAGAAYLPLDPSFPRERLSFMLDDAKVRLLVTEHNSLQALPGVQADVVCVDALDYERSDDNGASRSQPGDLAYVIYTSGSTGNPKGVQVTHGAVVNLLTSAGQTIGFTPDDKLLGVTTLSFDIAALEIFLPLISGGQLVLATRQTAADGTKLAQLLDSSRATVMQGTPATWRLLIESGWTGKKDLRILCGGEALSPSLADALSARAGKVWNFYGPTETTIWSTAWQVTPGAPISIGRPLANTQLYVLDHQLQPVPVGVAGELYIGGRGLSRGYLGRPELTAEKFVVHPFSQDRQNRLYRTGDCARYLPDGTLECLGRNDQQVKIRGFRIELGEIESALRQHQAVAHALVLAREDGSGEKRLVGYLLTRNGPPPEGELRDFLRAKLPSYMVPSHFVMLKEFPLTPNGKIDARRLPAPGNREARPLGQIAPRDDCERALAEVWQEVLALRPIGMDDDFFELGADSLSATRAFARINRRFGIHLPLRAIFENPTVARLALAVRKAQPAALSRGVLPQRPSRVVHAAP